MIGAARCQQRLGHLAVALGARELINGLTVPIQAEPGEPIEDRLDGGLRGALAVGVLDPQQHFPAASAGIEPVEQRGARPADMQEARGRGGKARDDGLGHVGWFLQRSAVADASADQDHSAQTGCQRAPFSIEVT